MKKINNITVAVDFSVTARNAYRYANSLAQTLNADLTIVHAKENPMIVSDVMIPSFPLTNDSELIEDIEELVKEENSGADKLPNLNIKVLTGDPATILIELPKHTAIDLMVIGTTGLSDVLTKLFGSVSLLVSNRAQCPVLLVPRDVKFQNVKQLLFAGDYDSMTSENVKKITDFASIFHADIHFVHVVNEEEEEKEINWTELLTGNQAGITSTQSTIYGEDVVNELKQYADAKQIDMMVFVSKHRNFWANITHKSVTQNMALSSVIPLLVMHLDDGE